MTTLENICSRRGDWEKEEEEEEVIGH